MINIDEVTKIDEKRKQIRKEIYTRIYEQFSSKIRQSVEYGHKQIFLTVPSFVLGYPSFDRCAAARYLVRQLMLGGFTVKQISDHDLYVSWIISKKKRERKTEESDQDFPNLVNLKKIANQYKRNA